MMATSEGDLSNRCDRPKYLAPEEEEADGPAPRPAFDYHPAEWYYDMSGDKIMLIFNHYEYQETRHYGYKKLKTRRGTAGDVSALTDTFEQLGFRVSVHHDKEHLQILNILRHLCEQDHSATSCVCVCVLTHGGPEGRLCAADTPYDLRDLLNILHYAAPGLVGKPKLLVVQACRGRQVDPGQAVLWDGPEDGLPPVYFDMLLLTASVEDFLSWRKKDGSWMIQELCRVVRGNYQHLDILQMTSQVTYFVAERHTKKRSNPEKHNMKQTAETRHALTKLLRLASPLPAPPPAGSGAGAAI